MRDAGERNFFYQRCRGSKMRSSRSLLTIILRTYAAGWAPNKISLLFQLPPRAHPPRPDPLNKDRLVAFAIGPTMCFSFNYDRHCLPRKMKYQPINAIMISLHP